MAEAVRGSGQLWAHGGRGSRRLWFAAVDAGRLGRGRGDAGIWVELPLTVAPDFVCGG